MIDVQVISDNAIDVGLDAYGVSGNELDIGVQPYTTILKGEKGDTGEKGEQGEKGAPFLFSDFTEEQLESLRGPKGDTGDQGEKGDSGEKGDPFRYEDFTEEQLSRLRGERGERGEKGPDGADGRDGADGISCTHEWDGTVLRITSASGTTSADLKGERGERGLTGLTGEQGIPGEKGETGEKGDPGEDGISILHYWNGTVLTVVSGSEISSVDLKGEKGDKGERGPRGYTGEPGADGKNGTSVSHEWNGSVLTIRSAAGSSSADLRGPIGEKGDPFRYSDFTSDQLERLRGPRGLTGLQGQPGRDGQDGKDGTSVSHRWEGTTLIVSSAAGTSSADLKGQKGDKGETGKAFTYSDFTEEQLADLKGEEGKPGRDGISVQHSWEGTTLSITSASGKSAVDLKGEKGDSYVITETDYQGIADKTAAMIDVPTKTSDLINDSGFLTEHQSLANYVQSEDYPKSERAGVIRTSGTYGITASANGYIQATTKTYEQYEGANGAMIVGKNTLDNVLDGRGYLTEHQSLEEYVKKADIPTTQKYCFIDDLDIDTIKYCFENGIDLLVQRGTGADAWWYRLVGYNGKYYFSCITTNKNRYFTVEESGKVANVSTNTFALSSSVVTDAHINDLIDAKLGVIENGTY